MAAVLRNCNSGKRKKGRGGPGSAKFVVIGAVQRGGNVVAKAVDRADTRTLDAFVSGVVDTDISLVATDEHSGYRFLNRRYNHGIGRYQAGQHVVGAIHTNTIEGFWSIFRRGIIGTFHKISKKYLHMYVTEFQFRYTMRQSRAACLT